jgi:hypothetical protein
MIYVIDNDLLVFFKKHNVIIEKLDVIRNFMITLCFVLEETYVGREFLVTTDDCYKHFKYGFVRTVSTETWHYEYHPNDAKRGPYAGFKGSPDANYKRTMAFKGKQINLASITV